MTELLIGLWIGSIVGLLIGTVLEHHNGQCRSKEAEDVLVQLDSYIHSHGMLKTGRGNVDDLAGFIDWYRAAR